MDGFTVYLCCLVWHHLIRSRCGWHEELGTCWWCHRRSSRLVIRWHCSRCTRLVECVYISKVKNRKVISPPINTLDSSIKNKSRVNDNTTILLNYLDRTPIRPRAENWFWLGGIGGIPKPCSEEFEDFRSVTPLGAWLPLMGPFNLWSGIPFWKDSFVGGGGRGGSSAGTAAPSSTHRFNFSS